MSKKEAASRGNLKTFTCPICGKTLINLSVIENQREFWCDCSDENYLIDILED
jgi:predicted RNA-binding Zn-ribbon protein involved in translation (DUF1610 family)